MRRAAPRLGDGQAQQRGKQAAGGAGWSLYRMPPAAHGGSREGIDYPG